MSLFNGWAEKRLIKEFQILAVITPERNSASFILAAMNRQGLFLVIFLPLVLSAQILKVDKSHLSTDSSRYITGVTDASININNRGSTPDEQNLYVGLNHNADIIYVGEDVATMFIGGINYFKIGDGPVVYNGSIHLREVFLRKSKFSPEIFLQVQFDESRNMELRRLYGSGVRWNVLRGTNSLHFGLGVFREFERWRQPEQKRIMDLWKLNSYLGGELQLSKTVSLNTIVYFQSGWDEAINSFRNRFSGYLEIKSSVTDHVKIKMASNLLIDSRPIIPVPEWIYETYFGVEYNFGG